MSGICSAPRSPGAARRMTRSSASPSIPGSCPWGPGSAAFFASDLGHWDVPEFDEPLKEAYELVERQILGEDEFEDFVFANPVRFYASMNPDFFAGTSIDAAAARLRPLRQEIVRRRSWRGSKMHQPRHRFLLDTGKTILKAGEAVEAGHVLAQNVGPLLGRKRFGQRNGLPSVIGPVGPVQRKVARPQEMGTAQLVAVLHRGPVLVDGEPEVATEVLAREQFRVLQLVLGQMPIPHVINIGELQPVGRPSSVAMGQHESHIGKSVEDPGRHERERSICHRRAQARDDAVRRRAAG